ncbi:MAG: DNA-binding protein [Sulfuricaulis sp.]
MPATTPARNLNEKEAATIIGISVFTLRYRRVHGGGPPFRKIWSRVIYPENLLIQWIEEHPIRGGTRTGVSDVPLATTTGTPQS